MSDQVVHHGLCRYVVLHHTGVDEPHYDLLFETSPASPLIAFRLAQWPPLRSQPAIKLRDHRRIYLTYQGAISGDRGQVVRVDEDVLLIDQSPAGYHLLRPDGAPLARIEPPLEADADPWWFHLPDRT